MSIVCWKDNWYRSFHWSQSHISDPWKTDIALSLNRIDIILHYPYSPAWGGILFITMIACHLTKLGGNRARAAWCSIDRKCTVSSLNIWRDFETVYNETRSLSKGTLLAGSRNLMKSIWADYLYLKVSSKHLLRVDSLDWMVVADASW